ncbi:hypothetical protein [Terrilactibacillus tamarindi]|uniref:hypothetical protein n=1 Tax=Terrilactibacillus tamarindi TaxID=2599694 RepID=UPI001E2C33C8|nr:hypothetical protein [Terrilactibacillus tamarindi]
MKHIMRDPNRIKRILTLLQKIWEHQADVRFNQLISNLQSLYSQENNSFGRREVYTKNFIDLEKTSYLDFFYLEDDKWEEFLTSYWSSIEQELMLRREEINVDKIEEVIRLFIEAGIESEQITIPFKENLKAFFVQESRWLTVEAIVNLVRNFSQNERRELFVKVKCYI